MVFVVYRRLRIHATHTRFASSAAVFTVVSRAKSELSHVHPHSISLMHAERLTSIVPSLRDRFLIAGAGPVGETPFLDSKDPTGSTCSWLRLAGRPGGASATGRCTRRPRLLRRPSG